MKLEINSEGKFAFSLWEAIAELPQSERWQIVQTLACSDELFNEVTNQILDGYTTDGWYSAKGCGGNPDAVHGIDGARMRIAKGASEVAAEEIKRLGEELARSKAREQAGWDAYRQRFDRAA